MKKNSAYKIMVVEDEAVIALRLQQMLTTMGYDVIGISYSGDDALKKARCLLPNLILMDIMIPGKMDGITVAEIVKSELNIPVIFLTAFSENKIIERAKKAEPFGYILKPFQDREIKAVIEVTLYRKEMEKALRESEKQFKDFLDNLGDAAYEADAFGNITYTNKAAEILTGLPLKKLIGKPFLPLFTEKSQKIAMDVYQGALNGERLEFELTFTNGKIARFKNEPIVDKDGKIIGVFGIARDITDRKQVEEALRKSEASYRAVMESQTEMICRFLPDGTLTFVNEAYCRYFDKGREELIGYKFMPLIPEGDREKVFNNIAYLNQNAPIITHEHRVLNSSGEMCWHKWTNRAIFDDQNNLTEYQAVGWDITERVKAEEALQKAHNDLDRRVKERTFELSNALKTVKRSETELSQRKLALEKVNKELLETNQAVSVLARNIDKKKEDLEKKYFNMCNSKLIPILKGLQKDVYCQKREADLELVINYLNEITHDSPLHHDIDSHLTHQEMRVAMMIKNGLTSQQIGDLLCISLHTIKTHRKNIRKKLKIENTSINLVSYLKSKLKA